MVELRKLLRTDPWIETEFRGDALRRLKSHNGFLLIEAMIASVILAVAALGIASLMLSADQQQQTLQQNSTAVLLARQLMEEIASRPFGSSTPGYPQVTRPFTTANQYNGYTDTTAGIPTLSGQQVAPGNGLVYTRTVSIANAPTPTGSLAPDTDLQLVTVTVKTPSNQTVTLNRLLTNVNWSQ